MNRYTGNTNNIEHVFISHSHFDHISDLPFLIENGFVTRQKQLNIYGLKDTIEHIKQFMFNDYIWPDFSLIPLLTTGEKSIKFQVIDYYEPIKIDDVEIYAFPVNHIIPTAGFVIKKENIGNFMISGDTYKTDELWDILNRDKSIKTLLIEISFDSSLDQLAEISKHLTPKLLDEELNKLQRDDLEIFVYHIKDSSYSKIVQELREYPNLVKYKVKVVPECL
jgi:cAMP phosphodiesterase